MTAALELRKRTIFKRCLWVSGLLGAQHQIQLLIFRRTQPGGTDRGAFLQMDFKRKKTVLTFHHCTSFIPKQAAKGISALWKFKEKHHAHMETHGWKNNNLYAGISKRTYSHLKGNLYSPKQNSESPNISVKSMLYNNIHIGTCNIFQELFSECSPTKCDFLHNLFTCFHFFLLTSYEIAIFISVASRFCMFTLNKNRSSKRMQKKVSSVWELPLWQEVEPLQIFSC